MSHKATCQTCKQFSSFESRREIPSRDLPPILALNANINSEDSLDIWFDARRQTFLSPKVEVYGQVDGMDDPQPVVYDLRVDNFSCSVDNITKTHLLHFSRWSSRL